MRTRIATLTAVAFAATVFSLGSCQKELSDSSARNESTAASARSYNGIVNTDKQERQILFVSHRNDAHEIYAMNMDGSNVVRLTFNDAFDGRATWSANGQHVAFASPLNNTTGKMDIYVMNANGSGLRNITNTPGIDEDWPEWAPQGNDLVFSSNQTGDHEIYRYDMDEGTLTRLTDRAGFDDKWPTYSPDGSKIAFQSNMGTTYKTEVFVMNADGSNIIRLTTNTALDQMPTWSPDGTHIAFMSNRTGNPDIFVTNADGTGQVNITNNAATDARPSWSWTTGRIVFMSNRDGGAQHIFSMNPDGSSVLQLTSGTTLDDFPYAK
jgi:Tol biopolymer transport system component